MGAGEPPHLRLHRPALGGDVDHEVCTGPSLHIQTGHRETETRCDTRLGKTLLAATPELLK